MTVRQAVLADVDSAAELFDTYRRFYRRESDPEAAARFLAARLLAGESVILLAERDGRAVGFAQCYPSFSSVRLVPIWQLNDLYVDETARGEGVGTSLLSAVAVRAAAAGAAYLTLETERTNSTAQRLYERHGYEREQGVLHYSLTLPT